MSLSTVLQQVFDDYDKAKTGKIPADEIYEMMEQIGAGLNKGAIQQLINEVDTWREYQPSPSLGSHREY